ncbi:MAG: M20 family metallopeptidase [Actinomycetota bacterium]
MTAKAQTREGVRERIERSRDDLIDLSHRIHANPELGYEEEQASEWLSDYLAGAGFDVTKGACDIPTAFIARTGSGPLHIAICAEYDSLPAVGHACGHNMIAAMAVGAGLGAATIADEVGLTVTVIGTPAEEGGGGKIKLLERGGFDGVHASMMVHPSPLDVVEMPMIAADHFDVHYTGKEAHASASPEVGINAADALTIAQAAIGLLRQHIRQTDRIHGFITKGGDAANIVPAHTSAHYMVRARSIDELAEIRQRVNRCFEAGALATGATLEFSDSGVPYAEVHHDPAMAALYKRNAEEAGRTFIDLGPYRERAAASTDMGNVSLEIPSIHPSIGIDSLPAVNHQPEFAAHCVTPSADKALFDGALAMAWTCADLAADDEQRSRLTRA